MISPITVGLVAGSIAIVLLVGGHWIVATLVAVTVWVARVFLAGRIARRVGALPRRIDPFALREPWRFFVSDALRARKRFAEAISAATDGPLRGRLTEIGGQLDNGVHECWEVAQRGQELTDARRLIDIDGLTHTRASMADTDARAASIDAQIQSHQRLETRENETREQLEALDARLDEAVVRAAELGTRAGVIGELESAGDTVTGVVRDLEALRQGLDDVGGGR